MKIYKIVYKAVYETVHQFCENEELANAIAKIAMPIGCLIFVLMVLSGL